VDRPRPVLCLFPLRWPRLAGCRGGAHVGGVRSSRSHPRFGDRCSGTRKAARLSRRATRPREIESASVRAGLRRRDRPLADRSALATRDQSPRSCVRLRRRGGVTTRGARLLGRLVSAEWIVPLRHWRAAALCTTGLFALRDWLMIHGSDPRHRPIRDCPRPPQDEGFLRQTVEMISVSRSEEDRFARPMGFSPTSRAR
jgi:hypothetical protein